MVPTKFQNKLFVGGAFVPSATGREKFNTVNPADEKVITDVHQASLEDVDRAVAAARHAFDKGPWRYMSGLDRGRLMFRLADLIE